MMIRFTSCIVALVLACIAKAGVFDVNGKQPDRIVVIPDATATLPDVTSESPMIAVTQGVLHELSRDEILALRAAARGAKQAGNTRSLSPFARLRLVARKETKDVLLQRDDRGMYYAQTDGSSTECIRLDPTRCRTLFNEWPMYRGSVTLPFGALRGITMELPRPYMHGKQYVTREELSKRLLRGRQTQLDDAARILDDERFYCRIPDNYKPDEFAGVLIWIQASTGDKLPEQLEPWLDDSNCIAVTALNSGNSRPVCDRYQIAFDMLATIRSRFLIDESRIYIGGISGGARVACHLWMGWPETFTGVLPVVGISFYDPIEGLDGKTYAPDFDKPLDGAFNIVKSRPLAAISGPKDFNYVHVAPCVERMRLVGIQGRLFESPDTGHEMPPPDLASSALTFIDAPAQAESMRRRQEAMRLLDGAVDGGKSRREVLLQVTKIAPWTPEAQNAIRLLTALDAAESSK